MRAHATVAIGSSSSCAALSCVPANPEPASVMTARVRSGLAGRISATITEVLAED